MPSAKRRFKKKLFCIIRETEDKVEAIRDKRRGTTISYDPLERQVWDDGKTLLLPLMQSKPLWAFEALFDYTQTWRIVHFYVLEIVEHFVPNSLPIEEELIAMLKRRLFDSKFDFLRRASLEMLGIILLHQNDRSLQNELLACLLDEDVEMRLASLRIFSEFPNERMIPFLSLLLDDSDRKVRQQSTMALSAFNSPAAQLALKEWLEQNPKS